MVGSGVSLLLWQCVHDSTSRLPGAGVDVQGAPACEQLPGTVVIGGGIAGIGAAWNLKVNLQIPHLILEAADYAGGHERTLHLDSTDPNVAARCNVDIGFMFGAGYSNLEFIIDRLSLQRVAAPITFVHKRGFDNTRASASRWYSDVERFEGLAESSKPAWGETFGNWLDRHNFDPDFVDEVIIPAITVLFVSGRGSLEKPAAMLLRMLVPGHPWVGLSAPKASLNQSWRVLHGNHQIIEGVVAMEGLDVRLNAHVDDVVVADDGVRITYVDGRPGEGSRRCVDADHVIFATDAPTTRKVYANPAWYERLMLDYFAARYSTTYGILHKSASMVPPTTQYAVVGAVLSGHLGYENRSVCPYVLSIAGAKSRAELESVVPADDRTGYAWEWHHPEQDFESIILGYVLGVPRKLHRARVRYAGVWTMVLGHEHGWLSGWHAAWSLYAQSYWQTLIQIRS
jgi:phytoene dehydrogenase-like protein